METRVFAGFALGMICVLFIAGFFSPADAVTLRGTISVSSEPDGADIYLNDEYLGLQTDTVIENVFPGIHYIRLELPGYRSWEKIFEVREGQITFISHEMEPLEGGPFTVSTEPEGGRIYIDGEFYGLSDMVILSLPTGQHRVLLTHDEYADYAAIVTISEGMSQSLVHTFAPRPTTGRVTVSSVPPDAAVYLNGEFVGTTSLERDGVAPGIYEVVIQKPGYEDWTGQVEVAAGKISEVMAGLTPAKVTVSFTTVPEGAAVSIDGMFIGYTPLEVTAEQGIHTILIEKFGYGRVEQGIDVGPEGTSLSFTLISMAPEAIANAEEAIAANLAYTPKKAQSLLEQAEKSYREGDSGRAIEYAQSAIARAWDVDGDGIPNARDISPNLHNVVIYLSPVLLIIIIAGVLVKDFRRHRVNPGITVNLPVTIREDDMLARARVTATASGGPQRGFVCTVYIDGLVVDHFTEPGTYDVMLAGRNRGVHRLFVHLQVVQRRYGKAEERAEETFIVEPAESPGPVVGEDETSIIETEDDLFGVEGLFEEKRKEETTDGTGES